MTFLIFLKIASSRAGDVRILRLLSNRREDAASVRWILSTNEPKGATQLQLRWKAKLETPTFHRAERKIRCRSLRLFGWIPPQIFRRLNHWIYELKL